MSSASEQPENVEDPSDDNNQLTCDAEVYETNLQTLTINL